MGEGRKAEAENTDPARGCSSCFIVAGIYNEHKEFVIVTGESVRQMKDIHDRTPILMLEDQIPLYLQDELEFQVDNERLTLRQWIPGKHLYRLKTASCHCLMRMSDEAGQNFVIGVSAVSSLVAAGCLDG